MWFVGAVWEMIPICRCFARRVKPLRHPRKSLILQTPSTVHGVVFDVFVVGYPRRRAADASTTFSTCSRQDKISIASTG